MSIGRLATQRWHRASGRVRSFHDGCDRVAAQMQFFAKSIVESPVAVRQYKGEMFRLIAGMSLGTGALAVIGGTVVIIGFLTMSTGAIIAVQGYQQLSGVGVEALTGFTSAF